MSDENTKAIAAAWRDAADFLGQYSDANPNDIARLRADADRWETQKLTKLQKREMNAFQSQLCVALQDQVFRGRLLPGRDQDQTLEEIKRVFMAINRTLYSSPPPDPEADISSMVEPGEVEHLSVTVYGIPADLGRIVKGTIALMKQFSKALRKNDFEAAYELTGIGMRAEMDFKQFVKFHEKSYKQFGGPPVQFQFDRFAYIYVDNEARRKSNTTKEGWPKSTLNATRRCRIIGYWLLDLKTRQFSCRAGYWIAEQQEKFCVEKFIFYTD